MQREPVAGVTYKQGRHGRGASGTMHERYKRPERPEDCASLAYRARAKCVGSPRCVAISCASIFMLRSRWLRPHASERRQEEQRRRVGRSRRAAQLRTDGVATVGERADAHNCAEAEDRHGERECASSHDEAAVGVEERQVGVGCGPLGGGALDRPVKRPNHPRQPESEEDIHRIRPGNIADRCVGRGIGERCRARGEGVGQRGAERDEGDGGNLVG
eukprot:1651470-Prymnesium_polylepis.1